MMSDTNDLVSTLSKINVDDFNGDKVTRLEVITAAKRLVTRLQTPLDWCIDFMWMRPFLFAAMQVFIDVGLWEAWFNAGGGTKSISELLKLATVNIDENLLRRLCRFMAASDIISEVSEDKYSLTDLSRYFGDKNTFGRYHVQAGTDHWIDCSKNLPQFLQKTAYKEPQDSNNTSYKDGNPEQLDFFTRCSHNPDFQRSFGSVMEDWSRSRNSWLEFYDTTALVQGAEANNPLLVDIGGNVGNDISCFLGRHPDIRSGALILQDRPDALKLAEVSEKIKLMPYDFFTPQPVLGNLAFLEWSPDGIFLDQAITEETGSRAYFFHTVLHNWPDELAIQILKNTALAMKKGYSKVLICEMVIPPTGATITQTAMDVVMMALVASNERTETMWLNLINAAGLKMTKWWRDPIGYETLIEAELA